MTGRDHNAQSYLPLNSKPATFSFQVVHFRDKAYSLTAATTWQRRCTGRCGGGNRKEGDVWDWVSGSNVLMRPVWSFKVSGGRGSLQ